MVRMNAPAPVVALLHPEPRCPLIGSRWIPGPIERRDSSTGFYELVNSPMTSAAELAVQRALLAPISAAVERRLLAILEMRGPR
jgi:hypothetical protein